MRFPNQIEIVLCHAVNLEHRTVFTGHAGVIFPVTGEYVYLEKTGHAGPFVRFDFRDRADLESWLAGAIHITQDAGYTNYFVSFNGKAIAPLIRPPPTRVELRAVSFSYAPKPVHVGDKVVFDYAVKNAGTNLVRGGSYRNNVYFDGKFVTSENSPPDLWPGTTTIGNSTPRNLSWQPAKAGRFHYHFVVTVVDLFVNGSVNALEGDIDVLPRN